jgi:hypothetical protein
MSLIRSAGASISRLVLAVLITAGILGSAAAQTSLRVMSSNLTSGNFQDYQSPGTHILEALKPDVALMQEFNVPGANDDAAVSAWVSSTFGPEYQWYREPKATANIPNGIISRYPIDSVVKGEWDDTHVSDRDFVYAKIDIPGSVDLYVISVHLLTSSSTNRDNEAQDLLTYISSLNAPSTSYFIVGGDFNTDSRSESCISTFSSFFTTSGPYPVGDDGTEGTNASRSKPYDWVLANSNLNSLKTTTQYGSFSYPNGLVFDTRDFVQSELDSAFSPTDTTDSDATSMQHMGVVRTFLIPPEEPVSDGDSVAATFASRAPATAQVSSDVPMLSISLTAGSNEWDAGTVSLFKSGTVADASVTGKIYNDSNNNGEVDSGEGLLGSSAFSGGSATISLSPAERATPASPAHVLLTAEIASDAVADSTLQLGVSANGIQHSASGGDDINPVFAAASSGVTSIEAAPVFSGPSVVINKYMNATVDAVELLVVQDNLDMRGMIIKDFSSSMANDGGGKYTFANSAFWSKMREGTLIILRRTASSTDVSTGGSDYVLNIGLDDTTYFLNSGGTFDIANVEMVMIKSAGSDETGVVGSIHTLAGGTATTQYNDTSSPKLRATTGATTDQYVAVDNPDSLLSDYDDASGTATGSATGLSLGSGNNATNTTFITFLRGTPASAATNAGNGSFRANWNALTTSQSYRLDIATNASFSSLVTGFSNLDAGSGLFYDVSGLPAGTYYYRVRGVNSEGTVSASGASQSVTVSASGIPSWKLY